MEIAIVGLQGAGKSTLVNLLSNRDYTEDVLPTVGFNMRKVNKGRVSIKIWDLGGQTQYRTMWDRYCLGMQAIVFVLDSSDPSSFEEARKELHTLLARPMLVGIPLLILSNKNDIPNTTSMANVVDSLHLKQIADREVAYYAISCKESRNIDATLRWLVQHK